MRPIITAVSIVALSVAGTTAFAGDERKSSDASSAGATTENSRTAGGVSVDLMKDFQGLDANRDGFLSKEELASKPDLANAFEKGDKDRDGKLDPAEYQVLQAEVNIKG
jgi:Ca2+-binding EF-hand superfamily protein